MSILDCLFGSTVFTIWQCLCQLKWTYYFDYCSIIESLGIKQGHVSPITTLVIFLQKHFGNLIGIILILLTNLCRIDILMVLFLLIHEHVLSTFILVFFNFLWQCFIACFFVCRVRHRKHTSCFLSLLLYIFYFGSSCKWYSNIFFIVFYSF